MAFDNTITEQDLDATAKLYVKRIQDDAETDSSGDGQSESTLWRILGLFGLKSRKQ